MKRDIKSDYEFAYEVLKLISQWRKGGTLGAQAENHLFSARNGILRDRERLRKMAKASHQHYHMIKMSRDEDE